LNYSIDSHYSEEADKINDTPEKTSSMNVPYFSINSNSISANYYSRLSELNNNIESDEKNLHNVFLKKTYLFFYFEINHFIFWQKEYLRSIYPELNLMMIVEINDNKLTQEKILFIRTDDASKYIPMKKKQDINSPYYRMIVPIDFQDKDAPFKINFSFYTYTNHKLLNICNDEIFIKITKEGEMKKYKLYQNVYMKHYNRKIGNIIYSFAYKTDELYGIDVDEHKIKLLNSLSKLEKLSKSEDDHCLSFVYYGIDNFIIKENGSSEGSRQQLKNQNYFSIKDIDDMEIGEELKSEDIKLDRLLELMTIVKKKLEFFQVLKKINNYISTQEFKEEKLIAFKEMMLFRLEEFSEKNEITDKIVMPFFFSVLKKAFFKIKPVNGTNQQMRKRNSVDLNMQKLINSSSMEKNSELMLKIFKLSFTFLKTEIQEDISLSALNYIVRYLEDNVQIKVNNKICSVNYLYFFKIIFIDRRILF
jgi:hypothetical protein